MLLLCLLCVPVCFFLFNVFLDCLKSGINSGGVGRSGEVKVGRRAGREACRSGDVQDGRNARWEKWSGELQVGRSRPLLVYTFKWTL